MPHSLLLPLFIASIVIADVYIIPKLKLHGYFLSANISLYYSATLTILKPFINANFAKKILTCTRTSLKKCQQNNYEFYTNLISNRENYNFCKQYAQLNVYYFLEKHKKSGIVFSPSIFADENEQRAGYDLKQRLYQDIKLKIDNCPQTLLDYFEFSKNDFQS